MVNREDLTKSLLLYAIAIENTPADKLALDVEQAILGGATMIQLREKKLGVEEYVYKATRVCEVCRKYSTPFIVDDSVEVALRSGADGLHVGQDDLDARTARQLLGADKIIGVSAKTVAQAQLAESMGADYLGTGAIYPTKTKDVPIMTSLETLTERCASVSIPVVAIGGLKFHNLHTLKNTGVVGAAIVTGIFAAADIRSSAAACLEAIRQVVD